MDDDHAKSTPAGTFDLGQDLAACKQVLGGLAHELKNPRQAMESVLYLLRAQPDLTDQSRQLVQSLGKELERMAVIIDQMLAAGRKSLRRELVQPRTVLEKVLSFYSAKIAFKHIKVVRALKASKASKASTPLPSKWSRYSRTSSSMPWRARIREEPSFCTCAARPTGLSARGFA